jgi:hypothetical protein
MSSSNASSDTSSSDNLSATYGPLCDEYHNKPTGPFSAHMCNPLICRQIWKPCALSPTSSQVLALSQKDGDSTQTKAQAQKSAVNTAIIVIVVVGVIIGAIAIGVVVSQEKAKQASAAASAGRSR